MSEAPAIPAVRKFSASVEAVARKWLENPIPNLAWKPDTTLTGAPGINAGYFVTCDGVAAYAKPSHPAQQGLQPHFYSNPGAAHEKIASDLAHHLALPVPPVSLWKRKRGAVEHKYAVSAVALQPFFTWEQILATPGAPRLVMPALAEAQACMSVFDSWLDNRDRLNARNLLLSMQGSVVNWAYIDFAQSMSFIWRDGPPWPVSAPVPPFPGPVVPQLHCLAATLDAIEALPDATINSIVARVPADFISETRRSCVLEGLRRRRDGLRVALRKKYGEPI